MKLLLFAVTLIGSAPQTPKAQTYGGNDCVEGCSGHRAGFELSERHGVQNKGDCIGNSGSFKEGCRTYLDDPYRGSGADEGMKVPE